MWVRAQLCKLQKGCTRLAAASDKVYQLLAQDRWFSLGTPASFTTKTGRHDIAELLLKVALNTNIQIQIPKQCINFYWSVNTIFLRFGNLPCLYIKIFPQFLLTWFFLQDSDRQAELSGTVMMFKQFPRKASILNMPVITTLYYCCFYHINVGEVSPKK